MAIYPFSWLTIAALTLSKTTLPLAAWNGQRDEVYDLYLTGTYNCRPRGFGVMKAHDVKPTAQAMFPPFQHLFKRFQSLLPGGKHGTRHHQLTFRVATNLFLGWVQGLGKKQLLKVIGSKRWQSGSKEAAVGTSRKTLNNWERSNATNFLFLGTKIGKSFFAKNVISWIGQRKKCRA